MAECYFKCDIPDQNLSEAGPERIKKIIESCKLRSDTIHHELQKQLDENPELTIACHRTCVSTYTSSVHIRRHLKRHESEASTSSRRQQDRRLLNAQEDQRCRNVTLKSSVCSAVTLVC